MDIKEILEQIALPARSNKKGFKVTEKLEKINELLKEQNSPFKLIHKTPQVWIFGKKTPTINQTALLVSSHADIVDNIKKPFSEYIEDEQYFKGTYDNLGTNAACVNLMINEKLPDNVYFAFTADEETGRCNGANYALAYIQISTNKEPYIFALDVTEEGYDNDRLFTIEGLHATSEEKRKKILQSFMDTEGENQSFEVVRLKKKDDNSFLPESYRAKDLTEYDESVFYAKNNCNSCSICLPGDGYMHSDSGFYIKEPVMEGYNLSLLSCILSLTTKNKDRIEELKIKKDELINKAKEIKFHRLYTHTYTGGGTYCSDYYGGGLGEYWIRKKREDNQIPGQMTLADYDDKFDYDAYDYYDDDFQKNDPFLLDELMGEFFEAAQYYDMDQFDVFYEDMIHYYGLKREDKLEEYMLEIFAEMHVDYDEDYDYE